MSECSPYQQADDVRHAHKQVLTNIETFNFSEYRNVVVEYSVGQSIVSGNADIFYEARCLLNARACASTIESWCYPAVAANDDVGGDDHIKRLSVSVNLVGSDTEDRIVVWGVHTSLVNLTLESNSRNFFYYALSRKHLVYKVALIIKLGHP